MSTLWRKNFFSSAAKDNTKVSAKLAFKTSQTDWLNTESPVIVPISIHTIFHEGLLGELKMQAFISIIKSHVKGKITILMTEKAHLKAVSIRYNLDDEKAYQLCLKDAQDLANRFKSCFEDCEVTYWQTSISNDPNYPMYRKRIMDLYTTDPTFQSLVCADAESTYTSERANEFPDKELFIQKTIEDLLEQCICIVVSVNSGYRFQFYPGPNYASHDYMNKILFLPDIQLNFIQVSLSVERKKIQSITV